MCLLYFRRGWTFGCGEKLVRDPVVVSSPQYEGKYATTGSTKGYSSSGYSSEALLADNIVDPRGGNYGAWTGASGMAPPPPHFNNNQRNHRGSQGSLGHIYESPDFANDIRTMSSIPMES